ncbi:MAG: response regulator, partial [Lachnospiraceae bacterium]|nr:response regulator [Lachnospiraceae bacterium]
SRYETKTSYPYDIFLFDVEMEGLNGLETAKRIREKNETSVILFITNKVAMSLIFIAMNYLTVPVFLE